MSKHESKLTQESLQNRIIVKFSSAFLYSIVSVKDLLTIVIIILITINHKIKVECKNGDMKLLGLQPEWAILTNSWICGGTSYWQTSNPSSAWKKWTFSKM